LTRDKRKTAPFGDKNGKKDEKKDPLLKKEFLGLKASKKKPSPKLKKKDTLWKEEKRHGMKHGKLSSCSLTMTSARLVVI